MNYVGKRIYYDKQTGNIVLDTGEQWGWVVPTTPAQDIETFKALSERNPKSFDYVELEYGQYAEDFKVCNGYRVNTKTKQLEFSYPDGDSKKPSAPPSYQPPLSESVAKMANDQAALMLKLMEKGVL